MKKEMSLSEGMEAAVGELPCSFRVCPLPRRWELTPEERQACHEAWLMIVVKELEPFLGVRRVRHGYTSYLKYGGWLVHGAGRREAAGSAAFDTHDFDDYMRSRVG